MPLQLFLVGNFTVVLYLALNCQFQNAKIYMYNYISDFWPFYGTYWTELFGNYQDLEPRNLIGVVGRHREMRTFYALRNYISYNLINFIGYCTR